MKENDKLIQALEELQEVPDRDPAVVQQNRAAFLRQAEELAGQTVSVSPFMRLISRFTKGQPRLQFSTLTIGIILGILMLTFSSGVYAARKSNPSQVLYPVKLWLEDSRMAFTRSPHEKLDLRLAYAEERLNEINGFTGNLSDPALSTTLHNFDKQYSAIQTLSGEQELDDVQQERIEKIQQQYQLIHAEEDDPSADDSDGQDGINNDVDQPDIKDQDKNNSSFDDHAEDTPQNDYEDANTETPQAENEGEDPEETESSDKKSPTGTPEPGGDSEDDEKHSTSEPDPTPEPTHEGKDDSDDSHSD